MAQEEKTLKVIEQKEVAFYNDELTAVRAEDGHVYVSIRHMCDALGVDPQGQTRRIRRQPVLAAGYTWVDILSTQPHPQRRRTQVLRVDLVPLWLTGISTRSIKDEAVRQKLLRFQQEAAKVLWEAFQEGRLTADPDFAALLETGSEAVQAYKMLQALVKLARNQIVLEARLDDHGRVLDDYGRRLETIEADMHQEDRYITESQATQISQAVKAIAIAMGKKTGRNEFGAIWGEFYRKFGIAKYRYLPASKFDKALAWLNEFYQELTGESPF